MSPYIYQGKIKIVSDDTVYLDIENELNKSFETYHELCNAPIIRVDKSDNSMLTFSIPFDNYCSLEIFDKEINKLLNLIENIGKLSIENGYINVFEIFGVEDPVQYKYVIKRKDNKISITKIKYCRKIYTKMKNYLKKSSKENLDFFNSLTNE